MRAVMCKEFGPPEKLVVEEIEAPVPGPGQVKLGIRAASVNFPDALIIQDKYQFKAPPPFIPGAEFSGEVTELVRQYFPGSRVSFEPDPPRQAIVDTWPEAIDCSAARDDWGFKPRWQLQQAFEEYLVPAIRERYAT